MTTLRFEKHGKLKKQLEVCVTLLRTIKNSPELIADLPKPLLVNNAGKSGFEAGLLGMTRSLLDILIEELEVIPEIDEKDVLDSQATMITGLHSWYNTAPILSSYAITIILTHELGSPHPQGEVTQYIFSKNLDHRVYLKDIFTDEGNITSRLLRQYSEICNSAEFTKAGVKLVFGGNE